MVRIDSVGVGDDKMNKSFSIFLLFTLVLSCGCNLFRRVSPEEAAWRRIEYAHMRYAREQIRELESKQMKEMATLKDRLWKDYQASLTAYREDIERKYAKLEAEEKRIYGNNEDLLRQRLRWLRKEKNIELDRKINSLYEDYKMRRRAQLVELAEKHRQQMEDLQLRLDAELENKRKEFEIRLAKGELPGEGVLVAATPEGLLGQVRRERSPFGELEERPFYVHNYVDIEATVEIDTRDALKKRLPHQAVITYYLRGKRREEEVPQEEMEFEVVLYLNGSIIEDWNELKKRLSEFRDRVYRSDTVKFPEVVLDQIGDVTRETFDKIIECCFAAGIRHIRSVNREPKIEQP